MISIKTERLVTVLQHATGQILPNTGTLFKQINGLYLYIASLVFRPLKARAQIKLAARNLVFSLIVI